MKVDKNNSELSCLELGTKMSDFCCLILVYFEKLSQKFLDNNLV